MRHLRLLRCKSGVFREAGLSVLPDGTLLAALWWVDATNPSLPLFNWETEGLLASKLYQARSTDGWETWSKPVHVDTGAFNKSTAIDSPILYTHGLLLFPFEQYKLYDEKGDWRHYSAAMLSDDLGKTWTKSVITGHDPQGVHFYWDQRPCVCHDGTVLFFIDTFSKAGESCGITGRRFDPATCQVCDMWDTGVIGQPGYPVELPDGTVCMVYNDRGSDAGIKLGLSFDGGRTFPLDARAILYRPERPVCAAHQKNLEEVMAVLNKQAVFGYPCLQSLPDGHILMCYYAGETADTTEIRWMEVTVEVQK